MESRSTAGSCLSPALAPSRSNIGKDRLVICIPFLLRVEELKES